MMVSAYWENWNQEPSAERMTQNLGLDSGLKLKTLAGKLTQHLDSVPGSKTRIQTKI